TPASTPEAVARGAKIYVTGQCRECHGKEARGDGPSGKEPSFKPSELPGPPAPAGARRHADAVLLPGARRRGDLGSRALARLARRRAGDDGRRACGLARRANASAARPLVRALVLRRSG